MKTKEIKRYYIVDRKTFDGFQDKDLIEISNQLETTKSYDSYDDAKQEFIRRMFVGDKQSDECTIVEISKFIKCGYPVFGDMLFWLNVILWGGLIVYLLHKVL